jgi:hypothetical protein
MKNNHTRPRPGVLAGAAVLLFSFAALSNVGAQVYPPPAPPVYPPGYPPPQYPYPQVPPVGTPPGQPQTALPEYRAPTIIVAAPAMGSTLPDDKPVAVFRFMTNEPLDPIDALTFSVSVDGKDRTSLFQLAQSEAWGRLAEQTETLTAGPHDVVARICTAHGECGSTKASITIVNSSSLLSATTKVADKAKQLKTKILDAVLQAARVLIHQ